MVRVKDALLPPVLRQDLPRMGPARFMASVLLAFWAATAMAVAAAYRPGGPLDLVVILACGLPVAVAAVGLRWPPVAVGHRHRAGVAWLWILALLLAIPVSYGVMTTLLAGGPQSLVPSAEAAYAGFVALFTMSLFSVLGYAHARRAVPLFERTATLRAVGLALLATSTIGLAFGLVALVNDLALRPAAPAASPYGPTDPELVPPLCDEPIAFGPNARIGIVATSSQDDVQRGRAVLTGQRRGIDEVWGASWAGPDGSGAAAYRRVGPRAWLNTRSADPEAPGSTWQSVAPDPFGLAGPGGSTMDGPPHSVVDVPAGSIVVEDMGLVIVQGARARHCRTFIDGRTALATFLPLRWLLDGTLMGDADQLRNWRGELDWWVFGDGQLGRASVRISGNRADTPWEADGVRATLRAELEAIDRQRAVDIGAPLAGPPGRSAPTPGTSAPAGVAGPASTTPAGLSSPAP